MILTTGLYIGIENPSISNTENTVEEKSSHLCTGVQKHLQKY